MGRPAIVELVVNDRRIGELCECRLQISDMRAMVDEIKSDKAVRAIIKEGSTSNVPCWILVKRLI